MIHRKLNRQLILFFGLFFICSCQRSQNIGLVRSSSFSSEALAQDQSALSKHPIVRKNNLESLTLGRNRDEIQKLMGEPDGKSLDGGNGYLWDYRRPVFDESTEKVYTWTLISFKFLKGRCSYITFQLEDIPLELLKNQDSGFGQLPKGSTSLGE